MYQTELLKYTTDNDSRVVEELKLPIAKARIDIAVVNGSLLGFEIKSASDTLVRLPHQIEAYTKVFDYLYVVTEGKYYQKVLDIIPEWVGLLLCEENGSKIKRIRKATKNKYRESFHLAKLLWREELLLILNQHQIKHNKKDRNWLLCESLSAGMNIDALSNAVRQTLKSRVNWKSES